MILNRDLNPQYCGYYIGAIILNEIKNSQCNSIDFMDLYMRIKIKHDVSIFSFSFALDWLFLIGAVKVEQGLIKKCF